MAQKLSDNIVKIAMVILIGTIAYLARLVTTDHDQLVTIAAVMPEMRDSLKELVEHKCRCGDNIAKADAQEILQAYKKYRLSNPKNSE